MNLIDGVIEDDGKNVNELKAFRYLSNLLSLKDCDTSIISQSLISYNVLLSRLSFIGEFKLCDASEKYNLLIESMSNVIYYLSNTNDENLVKCTIEILSKMFDLSIYLRYEDLNIIYNFYYCTLKNLTFSNLPYDVLLFQVENVESVKNITVMSIEDAEKLKFICNLFILNKVDKMEDIKELHIVDIVCLCMSNIKKGDLPLKMISMDCLNKCLSLFLDKSASMMPEWAVDLMQKLPIVLNNLFNVLLGAFCKEDIYYMSESGISISLLQLISSWSSIYDLIFQLSQTHKELHWSIKKTISNLIHSILATLNDSNNKSIILYIELIKLSNISDIEMNNYRLWMNAVFYLVGQNITFSDLEVLIATTSKLLFEHEHVTTVLESIKEVSQKEISCYVENFESCYKFHRLILCSINNVKTMTTNHNVFLELHFCREFLTKISNEFIEQLKNKYPEAWQKMILKIVGLLVAELLICNGTCEFSEKEKHKLAVLATIGIFKDDQEKEAIRGEECSLTSNNAIVSSISLIILSYLTGSDVKNVKDSLFDRILKSVDGRPDYVLAVLHYLKNGLVNGIDLTWVVKILNDLYSNYTSLVMDNSNIETFESFCEVILLVYCAISVPSHQIKTEFINVPMKYNQSYLEYFPFSYKISCQLCLNSLCVPNEENTEVNNASSTESSRCGNNNYRGILESVLKLSHKIVNKSRQMNLITGKFVVQKLVEGLTNHIEVDWTESCLNLVVFMIRSSLENCKLDYHYSVKSAVEKFIEKIRNNSNYQKWSVYLETITNKIDELFKSESDHCFFYANMLLKTILMRVPMKFIIRPMRSICRQNVIQDPEWRKCIKITIMEVVAARQENIDHLLKHCSEMLTEELLLKTSFTVTYIYQLGTVFDVEAQKMFRALLTPIFINLTLKATSSSLQNLRDVFESFISNYCKDRDPKEVYFMPLPESMVYFFLTVKQSMFSNIISFIERFYNNRIAKIISSNFEKIIHLLMMHLGDRYIDVLQALKWMAVDLNLKFETIHKFSETEPFTKKEIPIFIGQYVEGILTYFKKQLFREDVSINEKERVVNSLMMFVDIIGSDRMQKVRAMYFNVLKICLKMKSDVLLEKAHELWLNFVLMLDMVDLRSMAIETVAILVSTKITSKVVNIVNYLLENEMNLRPVIFDLHFILHQPGLNEFHDKYKSILMTGFISDSSINEDAEKSGVVISTERRTFNNSTTEFLILLECCNRNLRHSSQTVRQLTGQHLLYLLQSQRLDQLCQLSRAFLIQDSSSGSCAPREVRLVCQLTRNLIGCVTRYSTPELNESTADVNNSNIDLLVFGRCLGLLGAIDPGRYQEAEYDIDQQEEEEFVNSSKFSYHLLKEIGREYLSVTNSTQIDSYALAIQELLQTFSVSFKQLPSHQYVQCTEDIRYFAINQNILQGDNLWNEFPRYMKDVFRPFFNSRFFSTVSLDSAVIEQPIFNQQSIIYEAWVCRWVFYLIHLMKNTEHQRIFKCVHYLTYYDARFSKFILPHVILVTLIENRNVKAIRLEFEAVLQEFTSNEEPSLNASNFMNVSNSFLINGAFENTENISSQRLYSAAQTIFRVLDYLEKWLNNEAIYIMEIENTEKPNKELIEVINVNYQSVKRFVHSISYRLLASVSYRCGSLARAIKYGVMAYGYQKNEENVKDIFLNLLQTHAALSNEEEISSYLSTFKSVLEPFDKTIQLEYEGKLEEAHVMYEQKLAEKQKKIRANNDEQIDIIVKDMASSDVEEIMNIYESIFRTRLWDLPHLPCLLVRLDSCLDTLGQFGFHSLNSMKIEALAKMGDWCGLDATLELESHDSDSWTVSILKPLSVISRSNGELSLQTRAMIDRVWTKQLTSLRMAAIEGCDYERLHGNLYKLSSLTDLEIGIADITGTTMSAISDQHLSQLAAPLPSNIVSFLKQRYQMGETDPSNRDAVLVRHLLILLQMLRKRQLMSDPAVALQSYRKQSVELEKNLSEIWLSRAKVARSQKHIMSALYCLKHVQNKLFLDSVIEKGKVLWKEGRIEESLLYLNETLDDLIFKLKGHKIHKDEMKMKKLGKALLLRAHLSDITQRNDFETTQKLYQLSLHYNTGTEAPHFRLADFLDRAIKQTTANLEPLFVTAITEYGTSLMYGSKFVYQSMSRLLTLWLFQSKEADLSKSTMDGISKIIKQFIVQIPTYQFYVALNQIISQHCHETSRQKSELLTELLASMFIEYPQQIIWSLMMLENSQFPKRRERFQCIVTSVKQKNVKLAPFIDNVVSLCKALRELSESEERIIKFSWKKPGTLLNNIMELKSYENILIPLYFQLCGNVPTKNRHSTSFQPFPVNQVTLAGIKEEVLVLPSLTRPKKMTWLGSDGNKYIIVAKPKDDMRRDCRIMEMNGMFNRLMSNNTETRHKMLYIRTYAVIPLGEQSGLIEWVNNTVQYRTALLWLCKLNKENVSLSHIRSKYSALEDSIEVKIEKFTRDVLPLFPILLHQWLHRRFPEPSRWYRASLRFARSCAVMSMVGYVLGLGDRHVENLLLDESTGDVIHIDFNCLFEQGRTLQWPEVVPFRLTRNMCDALGPCGAHSGQFRASCAATLGLLRQQTECIMAVFRPMYHDTLVENRSSKSYKFNRQAPVLQKPNTLTEERLDDMEKRLKGYVNQLPMSVEGQISSLIADAIDNRNLCRMYVGWASYM